MGTILREPFYEFKCGDEWVSIVEKAINKYKVRIKVDSNDRILTYSLNNGVFYVTPCEGVVLYNSRTYYQFFWHLFQHLKNPKIINIYTPHCLYSVPYTEFVLMSNSHDNRISITKKLYIPVNNLLRFAVAKY